MILGFEWRYLRKVYQWHGKQREGNGFKNIEGKTDILVITYEICYRFTCYFYGFWLWKRKICLKLELGRYHRERCQLHVCMSAERWGQPMLEKRLRYAFPSFYHIAIHASSNLPSHYKPSCLIQSSITLQIIIRHPIFHHITNHHASSNLPSQYIQIIIPHPIFHHITNNASPAPLLLLTAQTDRTPIRASTLIAPLLLLRWARRRSGPVL
jgi:hypothetical protein